MKKQTATPLFLTAFLLVVGGLLLLLFGKASAILTGLVCVVLGISLLSFVVYVRSKSLSSEKEQQKQDEQQDKNVY